MNLEKIGELLEATGYPVAYSHFVELPGNPLPNPPYVTYLVTYSSNFHADNKVHKQIQNVDIELYTDRKDLQAESIVESILDANEIPYETVETFIESEKLFQIIYEVRLF